jgi:hypothetical protein
MEDKHGQLAERFAKRGDRFSQLLSRVLQDEHAGQYLVTRSALSADEYKELERIRPDAHKALRIELDEAYGRLRGLLEDADPFHVIATIQFANLFVAWGSYYEPSHKGSEAKVELVCGFLATQPPNRTGQRPAPEAMQAIFDELDHIEDLVLLVNLTMPAGDDHTAAAMRFSGAMRWMSLRGNSFAGHGPELAQEVYRPYGDWLLEAFGFSVDDVLAVGQAATELTATRMNDLGREGAETMNRAGGPSHAPGFAAAVLETLELFDARIRGVAAFTAEDLLGFRQSLDADRSRAVLDELSTEVGSLEASTYTGLFDVNPLRERPLLRMGDEFVLAIPGMLTRDADALLEHRLLAGRPNFPRQRAKTLDRLAVRYLTNVLPGAAAYTNLYYEDTELDGLVLFDDVAVVIEGKAGGMSVPARRGDVRRLREDIQRNVEDAWRQAARARAYLLRDEDSIFRNEDGEVVLRVPAGSVRDIVIVNPTLHELHGHASQLGGLRALGLFPEDELPWSVYINDLRVVAETSDNAAVFLHYPVWRSRLPLGDGVVVWDEMDLWASYLMCERFAPLSEHGKIVVANSSTDFDAYYDGLAGHGPRSKRPAKFLKEPVRSFVSRMAEERPAGWRSAAGACLDMSIPELAVVATKATELATEAAHDGSVVGLDAGRLGLLGVPPGHEATTVMSDYPVPAGDPTLVVACRLTTGGKAEVAWAGYRKPVTFELSAFERAAFDAASPFAVALED